MTDDVLNRLISACSNPNESPFGQWINSIFSVVDGAVEAASIVEKKELFLQLLGSLIDREIIVVFPPEEFYRNGVPTVPCRTNVRNFHDQGATFSNIWDATSTEVTQYIRNNWPESVTESEDEMLNIFWYGNHCPRIGWYDQQTDSVIAS
jgi:hypothetical protein